MPGHTTTRSGLAGVLTHALATVVAFGAALASAPNALAEQPDAIPSVASATAALHVVVTIPPLKGMVSPLLPAGSEVRSLMPPGRGEHGFEFTPGDLAALAKADIVVLVGLGLEVRVEKELKEHPVEGRVVLNLGEALGLKQGERLAGHHEHSHEQGDHGEHSPAWVDQHVWLDPVLVESLIPKVKNAIASGIERHAPSTQAAATAKAALDQAEIDWTKQVAGVNERYTSRLAPLKGRVFITHHNAFSRLADRYGLHATSIRELEGTEPTPGEIASAVLAIRKEHARVVFVEPQMNKAVPTKIADVAKVKVGVLDPLGEGNWIELMDRNLGALVAGLGDSEPGAAPTKGDPPAKDAAAAAEDSKR